MRSSAAVLDPIDAAWPALTAAYQIEDVDGVRAFLAAHPAVPDLLLEIREAVRPYFGDDQMALRIFIDPEWEEAEPGLFAVVRTRHRDALARLRSFDHEWWIEKLKATRQPVVVSYDIIPRQ